MQDVRTTVTLDSDAEALVKRRMQERNIGFKQAVNELIREGATSAVAPSRPLPITTFAMGVAKVPLDKALELAGQLEDEARIRQMRVAP